MTDGGSRNRIRFPPFVGFECGSNLSTLLYTEWFIYFTVCEG